MHEVGVAQEILEIVARTAREQGLLAVRGILVEVGRLSGVDPESLRFALEVVGAGTLLEGADVRLVQPPLLLRCDSCGSERETALDETVCPRCGSPSFSIERGRELLVRSIEGE